MNRLISRVAVSVKPHTTRGFATEKLRFNWEDRKLH